MDVKQVPIWEIKSCVSDLVILIKIIHTQLFFSLHTCGNICLLWKHSLADRRVCVITLPLLTNRQVTYDGTVTSSGCFISLWGWYVEKGWEQASSLNKIFSLALSDNVLCSTFRNSLDVFTGFREQRTLNFIWACCLKTRLWHIQG